MRKPLVFAGMLALCLSVNWAVEPNSIPTAEVPEAFADLIAKADTLAGNEPFAGGPEASSAATPACPEVFNEACVNVLNKKCRSGACTNTDTGVKSCLQPDGNTLRCPRNKTIHVTACPCNDSIQLICCTDGTCTCGTCSRGSQQLSCE